jgi:hypothetical protein
MGSSIWPKEKNLVPARVPAHFKCSQLLPFFFSSHFRTCRSAHTRAAPKVLSAAGTPLQSAMVRVVCSHPRSWTPDYKTRALSRIGHRAQEEGHGVAMKIEPFTGGRTSRAFRLTSTIPCPPGDGMKPREPKPRTAESRDATDGKWESSKRTPN